MYIQNSMAAQDRQGNGDQRITRPGPKRARAWRVAEEVKQHTEEIGFV